MIHRTRPVAARPKWVRMSCGRMCDPGSRCSMPPWRNQMLNSTKPPPAVTTHAMSAAHSMSELPSSSGTDDGTLRKFSARATSKHPASVFRRVRPPGPEGQHDRTRGVCRLAGRCLAADAIGPDATDATLDQAGPHSVVDAHRVGAPQQERPERARRGRQLRPVAVDRAHRGLEAERPEGVAHPLEAGADASSRLQSRSRCELAAEVLARLAK